MELDGDTDGDDVIYLQRASFSVIDNIQSRSLVPSALMTWHQNQGFTCVSDIQRESLGSIRKHTLYRNITIQEFGDFSDSTLIIW